MLMSTSRATPTGIGANNATEGDNLNFLNVITAPVTAPITANQQGGQSTTPFNAPEPYPTGGYFANATATNPAFPTASPISPVFFQAGSQNISVPFADLGYQQVVGGNSNSATTALFSSRFGTGNRWEFGYMDTDDYGWLVSILDHVSSGQNISVPGGTVLFNDPTGFLQGYQTSISGELRRRPERQPHLRPQRLCPADGNRHAGTDHCQYAADRASAGHHVDVPHGSDFARSSRYGSLFPAAHLAQRQSGCGRHAGLYHLCASWRRRSGVHPDLYTRW